MMKSFIALVVVCMLAATGVAQTPPANAVAWDYSDADVTAGAVAVFLVCLDGQPTTACATVPVTSGVTSTTGVKTYQWKLPAVTPGSHRVAVQACTQGLGDCSSGIGLSFVVKVTIANPSNLRLSSGGQ